MLACKRNRTTGFAGGWKTSQTPAPTISMPFTSRETPMKNQMEIPPSRIFGSVPSLPEENVYGYKEDRDYAGPKRGTMIDGDCRLVWNGGHAVDEAAEFGIAFGFGDVTDDDGDHDANDPGPQGAVHVLGHVARVGGKCNVAQRRGIDLDPRPHADGRNGSGNKSPETAGAGGAFPEHAENDGAVKRRDEETEKRLNVIHDAREGHHEISSAHADQNTKNGAPAAHGNVMRVGLILFDECAIDVVGPNGSEGADVPGHAGHEAGDEGGDPKAEETRTAVTRKHERQYFVVAVATARDGGGFPGQLHGQDSQSEKSRQNDDERNEHLEGCADDGSHLRGTKILGGENALDDEEIRRPIAEGDDKAKTKDDAGPMNAHGIVFEGAQGGPEMRVFRGSGARDLEAQIAPAASFNQTQDRDQRGAGPDQNELQNFVEDCGTQASERYVDGNGGRGNPDAEVDVPAENHFQHQRHGIHVDAAHEHSHQGERNGGERAAGLTETEFEVAGHGVRLGNVIERHHHDAEEQHGRNGADPIPVSG